MVDGRPALGILELASIARGVRVSDAVVKRAPSQLLMSRPVSGGKHLVMLCGGVAEVEESMLVGRELAGTCLVDSLELAQVHEQLWPLLEAAAAGSRAAATWSDGTASASVAIIETRTVCAAVHAADVATKAADVVLRDMRLAEGIAGKAFFSLSGLLSDVEAAADAARAVASDRLLELEVIAAPHDDIHGRLIL